MASAVPLSSRVSTSGIRYTLCSAASRLPDRPFITTAAATASTTPSPCSRVGRSPNSVTDKRIGTSTPSRVNTEERIAPFLWML